LTKVKKIIGGHPIKGCSPTPYLARTPAVAITTVGAAAGCSVCLTGRRAEFIAPKRIIPATTAQYCAKYNNAENHKKTSHIASAKNILSIRRRRSYAILICSALKKTVTGQFTGGLRYTK
jgi:hypothetical protein